MRRGKSGWKLPLAAVLGALLCAGGLIPSTAESNIISLIGYHETEHVAFLQSTIQSLGGIPITSPAFDFTGGSGSGQGPFRGHGLLLC